MKPEPGGCLLVPRRITPLAWRHTVYRCSGAYNKAVFGEKAFARQSGILRPIR